MLKQYLETGQIVSTHGVKGEVRFDPWCDSPDFMKRFKTLYFDDKGEKPVKVLSCRPHGNIVILKLQGTDTVADAQKLRNTVLYMNRDDAKIKKGDWFIRDLLGCSVCDADDNAKIYGKISDVQSTGANDIWFIDGTDGKEYIIPAIKDVVITVDVENEIVYIRPLKGIFDDIEELRE
ncbi:MAG: ribosome maturation factor RimM [Clostridiales bacterium]|nr:ribosome maturation factor RimM [Clostridiales bacterium]